MIKIGNISLRNKFILAPMAGFSSAPARRICVEMGAGAAITEMVSGAGMVYGEKKTLEYLNPYEGESPLWAQLFGADPMIMARAAEIAVRMGADILDINFGCPVKKVVKSGAGCALMRNPPLAAEIVRAMKGSVSVPITAKLRSGWEEKERNYAEFCEAIIRAGIDGICLHPRTRAQGFSGRADWREIKRLVGLSSVPVFGSGDVFSMGDALRMLAETDCAGVMVARGALGNPWIFKELLSGEKYSVSAEERFEVIMRHLRLTVEHFGGRELAAVKSFRAMLVHYTKGLKGAVKMRRELSELDTIEKVEKSLRLILFG
ncbi:MAG: tRNA dihydrouridine synthase DusB [Myxococcota bacterium]